MKTKKKLTLEQMRKLSEERRQEAIKAVQASLNKIDYPAYASKVAANVAKKAEIQHRVRVNSMRGARTAVFLGTSNREIERLLGHSLDDDQFERRWALEGRPLTRPVFGL